MFRNLISLTIIASLIIGDLAVLSHRHDGVSDPCNQNTDQSTCRKADAFKCACSHHHGTKMVDVGQPKSGQPTRDEDHDSCLICAAKLLSRLDTSFDVASQLSTEDVPKFTNSVGYPRPTYEFYLLLGSPLRGPPCA